MALKIVLPYGLSKKSETYLLAALQDSGAEHISANEWRFSQIVLSCDAFVAELRAFLPETERWLADRITVTIFHP